MKNIWPVLGIIVVMGIAGGIWVYQQRIPVATTPTQSESPVIIATISPSLDGKEAIATSSETIAMTPTPTVKSKTYSSAPPMSVSKDKTYRAIVTTSKGTMKLTLFVKDAPITVNNFVFLAREGFYADTVFHRIIKGFMIQGGDPLGTGSGGPGYRFADEPVTKEYTKGTIAMANAGPNTNGSQFFIMHADYALPKNYVIFGAIDPSDSASMVTLDAIGQTPVTMSAGGEESKPTEKVTVQSVIIEEK